MGNISRFEKSDTLSPYLLGPVLRECLTIGRLTQQGRSQFSLPAYLRIGCHEGVRRLPQVALA